MHVLLIKFFRGLVVAKKIDKHTVFDSNPSTTPLSCSL